MTTTTEISKFNIKTPYLEFGKSRKQLSASELLDLHLLVFTEGGENEMHNHPDDNHAFIVLEGEATFHVETEDNVVVVGHHEGLLLPKDTNYRFQSSGSSNLIMVRVGANYQRTTPPRRFAPDGGDLPGGAYDRSDYINARPRAGAGFGD